MLWFELPFLVAYLITMRYRLCKLSAISLQYGFSPNRRWFEQGSNFERFDAIFSGNLNKTTSRQNCTWNEPASSISIFHKQETIKYIQKLTNHGKYRHYMHGSELITVTSPVIHTSDIALQSSKQPKIETQIEAKIASVKRMFVYSCL